MVVLVALGIFSGCNSVPEEVSEKDLASETGSVTREEQPSAQSTARYVGVVEAVHETGRFVLIRSVSGSLHFTAGEELSIVREGGDPIVVKVSPERNRRFLVADYADDASPVPFKGNPVYRIRRAGMAVEKNAEEAPSEKIQR